MSIWSDICQIMRHADRGNEMAYQKYVKDLVLEMKLGWHKEQISEQLSLQLGATERLIPDIMIAKDEDNRFIIEFKRPGHVKSSKDLNQLVSYMKQLETPIGIYFGDEMDIYYKNIGDGSDPLLLMTLYFDMSDSDGDDFVMLFNANAFSIENILFYKKERERRIAYQENCKRLLNEITSNVFKNELKNIISTHLIDSGENEEIVNDVLNQIDIRLSLMVKDEDTSISMPTGGYYESNHNHGNRRFKNNGVAQRYAYSLIRSIIDRNPTLRFNQLMEIFGRKNYIENITQIKDESRWFIEENDIIKIADGTKVVVSNQWGFRNNSKPKMTRLREIARKYGIDDTLPTGIS